jgi:hypothetical protein
MSIDRFLVEHLGPSERLKGRDFFSIRNSLHLVERHGIVAPIVKGGRSRRFMPGHLLGDFELAAVLQVRGDPGGAEAVGADFGPDAGGERPSLDHHVDVGLGQASAAGQPSVPQRREERSRGLAGQTRRAQPFV